MDIKLFVMPGSHPCVAVEAALNLKGLHYERVDLLPGAAPLLQRARFGRRTVPGLIVDGYRVSGSRLIMRTLEGIRAEPRLYPSEHADAIEEAERWGDRDMQDAARAIIVYALTKRPDAGDSYTAGANLPQFPAPVTTQATRAVFAAELKLLLGGQAETERWLRELPTLLDKVEGLIDSGVLGGESPNAADLQIAASIRMLLTFADLRDAIDARPAGRFARRLIPRYPGDMPAGTLPADWIPSLDQRSAVAASA
jgi:glutathione S-transferase